MSVQTYKSQLLNLNFPTTALNLFSMEAINMRRRTVSTSSSKSSVTGSLSGSLVSEQELDALYDFLAKIILLGPSGCGKSCILHRFVKDECKCYEYPKAAQRLTRNRESSHKPNSRSGIC